MFFEVIVERIIIWSHAELLNTYTFYMHWFNTIVFQSFYIIMRLWKWRIVQGFFNFTKGSDSEQLEKNTNKQKKQVKFHT